MGIRPYFSPIVGLLPTTPTPATAYASKIVLLASPVSARIQHKIDGTPKFDWCLAVVRQSVWTTIDLDLTLERVFGADLPDTLNTSAEFKAYLKSHTLADIPAANRPVLNAKLTAREIDVAEFTLKTTWFEVVRAIMKFLHAGQTSRSEDELAV